MQIEIRPDPHCREPKLIKVTEEINTLIRNLSDESPPFLAGFQGCVPELPNQSDIIRIYASGGKVPAVTDHGEYVLKLRLYELEERLDKKEFDLSYAGTICPLSGWEHRLRFKAIHQLDLTNFGILS